jgi:lipopolysaccharide/colanic/teichoic acid biosynthesis glycosyltransferase
MTPRNTLSVSANALESNFVESKLPQTDSDSSNRNLYDPETDGVPVPTYALWKRLWELPLALLLSIAIVPAIGFLALLVRCTSPGAGIYRQTRVGRHGQTFTIYKIRSMVQDAEAGGAQWAQGKHDQRATGIGSLLRRLHLDELPQIFNILKGDMSFCGPRPERPEIINKEKLVDRVPGYSNRLSVRPGVTGLAQINLPADDSIDSVRMKQCLDMQYIEQCSASMDLGIIACTVLKAVGIQRPSVTKLFGVMAVASPALRFSDLDESNLKAKDGPSGN